MLQHAPGRRVCPQSVSAPVRLTGPAASCVSCTTRTTLTRQLELNTRILSLINSAVTITFGRPGGTYRLPCGDSDPSVYFDSDHLDARTGCDGRVSPLPTPYICIFKVDQVTVCSCKGHRGETNGVDLLPLGLTSPWRRRYVDVRPGCETRAGQLRTLRSISTESDDGTACATHVQVVRSGLHPKCEGDGLREQIWDSCEPQNRCM